MCSSTLHRMLVRDIGLELDARLVTIISFFEKRADISSVPVCGDLTSVRDCWNMTCRIGAITSQSLWSTRGFSWSGPAALWGLRSFNSYSVPFRETVMFDIWGRELRVSLGIWDGCSLPSSTKSCTAMLVHVS